MGIANSSGAQSSAGSATHWAIDWARPEDESELIALFQKVFGHPVTEAQWRWRYGRSASAGIVVRSHGKVIAFYGGMPRPILFRGNAAVAVQIGDVMVDPKVRSGLARKGPFYLATSAFLNQSIGVGKRYKFGFGFPTDRAMRVAERSGLYVKVDELLEAVWKPLPWHSALLHPVRPLPLARISVVDELWQAMAYAAGEVAIGVRDAAFIQHRFLGHPTVKYLCLLVTSHVRRRPRGLVVLRDRGAEGVELVDIVGPPHAFRALVEAARRTTGRLGRSRLFAWMTPAAVEWFSGCPALTTPTGFVIPASALDVPEHALQVRGRWWLTGGDTDIR